MQQPYPSDTRAKGWRFELEPERIRQSDTWALATPELRPWLLMLWMVAWEQTPCGSLPADDALICARLGMPPKLFAKHRAVLLRGWEIATDGRLYHLTITERVLRMLASRAKDRVRTARSRAESERVTRDTSVTPPSVTAASHVSSTPEPEPEEEQTTQGASAGADALPGSDPIPVAAIVDAYNATMEQLPKVRLLTPKRRTLIRRAWQTDARFRSVGFWQAYFTACSEDNFLNGTGPYTNGHENWRPDLDHLLKPQTVARVFERALDRGERGA